MKFASLGRAWIHVVERTLQVGTAMSDEGYECLGVQVEFPAQTADDPILQQHGDREMVANMQKVFFADDPNPLGHSYARLIRGPDGRNDLQDIIDLLRTEPWSKRALATLCGNSNGKVPCINAIQFLIRDGVVQAIYFARGQDAFRKFYADALCIASMVRKVADGLELPSGNVIGFIGSCHLYHRDVPQIRTMLDVVQANVNAQNQPPSPPGRGEGEKPSAKALNRHLEAARGNGR